MDSSLFDSDKTVNLYIYRNHYERKPRYGTRFKSTILWSDVGEGWGGNCFTVNLAKAAKTFLHSVLVGKLSFNLKHSCCTHANN